jgi:hypothetical protein
MQLAQQSHFASGAQASTSLQQFVLVHEVHIVSPGATEQAFIPDPLLAATLLAATEPTATDDPAGDTPLHSLGQSILVHCPRFNAA